MRHAAKRFVYVIVNDIDAKPYVGLTSNVARRLDIHNGGGSIHTKDRRPWRLAASVEFADERRAATFERYLKSGSGRAFTRRHLL
jgi:putative endonuclease